MIHACPQLPDLSSMTAAQLAELAKKPLSCVNCGQELQLTCKVPKRGVIERIIVAPVRLELIGMLGAEPALRAVLQQLDEIKTMLQLTAVDPAPVTVSTTAGEPAETVHEHGARRRPVYADKKCIGWQRRRCGKTFTPTGPRSVRCTDCQRRKEQSA